MEDQAHELFIGAMVHRLAADCGKEIVVRVRSARGGHGRVLSELSLYQQSVEKGLLPVPDTLVVAIDANCQGLNAARKQIRDWLTTRFRDLTAIACPDPHVERWYVADPASFKQIVGAAPRCAKKKCQRNYYKNILARTVVEAGQVPTLGGIEFAGDLVKAMDLDRASDAERSLKAFLDDMRLRLKNP
ncbi:MAG: hypothetical protein NT049_02195 [Planctomycetota bacterium]|nr:hypothetical protein [Planctomycetota bacterium]